MTLPTTVTMLDIAGNIADKPTLMRLQLNGKLYPEVEKHKGLLAKSLTYTPFEHGTIKIDGSQLAFSDENGHVFKTITTAGLTQIELGMYHSMVRTVGPFIPYLAQYTVVLKLTMADTTYQLLIIDPQAVPGLLAWLKSQQLTFTDPLNLAGESADFDWREITEDQFKRWSKGTTYADFFQAIGSKLMF